MLYFVDRKRVGDNLNNYVMIRLLFLFIILQIAYATTVGEEYVCPSDAAFIDIKFDIDCLTVRINIYRIKYQPSLRNEKTR